MIKQQQKLLLSVGSGSTTIMNKVASSGRAGWWLYYDIYFEIYAYNSSGKQIAYSKVPILIDTDSSGTNNRYYVMADESGSKKGYYEEWWNAHGQKKYFCSQTYSGNSPFLPVITVDDKTYTVENY